jgi:hypothetical protein
MVVLYYLKCFNNIASTTMIFFLWFVMCGWKSLDDVSIKQMAMEIRSMG